VASGVAAAFNKKLSERRAAMIKQYLVDNFRLSAANLRTVGYGRTRPKGPAVKAHHRCRIRTSRSKV
jgi:outer membrane protein OmpA-like peptidoglycan-associated protein